MKLALAGIDAGLGAKYLGNKGKDETFTSYPNPSRIKQLLGVRGNGEVKRDHAKEIMNMAHGHLQAGRNISPSLAKVILELTPEDYGEDLAETIYEYQQFLTGQWGVDKKGRAAKGGLHLRGGMTPEQYLTKHVGLE